MSRFDDDEEQSSFRAQSRVDPIQAIELLGRRLGGAILVGSALIALGLYAGSSDEGPKFQAFATDGEVFRVNTENGTIIACNGTRCTRILQRGQDLAEDEGGSLFKLRIGPQAAPAPATPQAAPANPPAQQQRQLPPPEQR
jgi:hypothetical protein